MIKRECRDGKLKLVEKDEDFDDLIEWKLYQLHKPTHGKYVKKNANKGMWPAKILWEGYLN